ncbi:MAG: hypothetical protein H7Z72_04040 [Bacteroidetes bacterium]|nr:hypothetical protein [Fibrella sp.]
MKTGFFLLFLTLTTPALAQQRLSYTIWADGLVNPQLPRSSLYSLGTGLRGEISRPLRHSANRLFAQVGYGHFFQKSTGAFTANIGLVSVGYRYYARKAFTASVGVGAQYWSERMRVRFPDAAIAETFNNLMPGATVGFGFRVKPRCSLGAEYRGLFKPEAGTVVLRSTIALSIGYTL